LGFIGGSGVGQRLHEHRRPWRCGRR
jgi:ABC-type phosphate/phosphonate transport system permease subunit